MGIYPFFSDSVCSFFFLKSEALSKIWPNALFIVGMLNIVAIFSQLFPLFYSNKFNEFFFAPPSLFF